MSDEKKIKVMILDDDHLLIDMYSMKFESQGFEVMKVSSTDECLDQLRDGANPNILVMDMVMPGDGGIGLLKKIREEELSKDSKILVLSNQSQNSEIEEAEKYNIDGYVIKAESTPTEVVDKVKKILE
ncbi:MAG: CheY-like chemotaxis protein [Candidatus Paceibacteria bacterium]|jgi:CheY-like chemotaxis protein